jgi:hypothetical protein
VITQVGTDGNVCIFTRAQTDLVVDVTGNYPNTTSFTPLIPARLLDTRPDGVTIDGRHRATGRLPAGRTYELPVTGRGSVAVDASAVVLNVTAVSPDAPGFLTVWPCGVAMPLASSVNYLAGQVVPNAVITQVGTDGNVCIFTRAQTDLVVDVTGNYPRECSALPTAISNRFVRPCHVSSRRQHQRTDRAANDAIGLDPRP